MHLFTIKDKNMIEQVNIYKAEDKDAKEISLFNILMAKETEDKELDESQILLGVQAMIDNPHMGFYLVAKISDITVASLMVTTEWSDWRNGIFWWIQSVYVKQEYRRKGLYRKLYEHVKALSKLENNVCGFRLYVEQENLIAQKTYKKLGMEETHYKMFEEASD